MKPTKLLITSLLAGIFVQAALASAPMVRRGTVVEKTNSQEAVIVFRKLPLKAGDKLEVYSLNCREQKEGERCLRKVLGTAEITSVLAPERFAIKVAGGAEFEEGDFVRKKTRR